MVSWMSVASPQQQITNRETSSFGFRICIGPVFRKKQLKLSPTAHNLTHCFTQFALMNETRPKQNNALNYT